MFRSIPDYYVLDSSQHLPLLPLGTKMHLGIAKSPARTTFPGHEVRNLDFRCPPANSLHYPQFDVQSPDRNACVFRILYFHSDAILTPGRLRSLINILISLQWAGHLNLWVGAILVSRK